MSRTRIVRKLNSETRTSYQVYGFQLTEKMKKDLSRNGVRENPNQTWYDVFPNADIVYRFNPLKGKYDVFIGEVTKATYPSGKTRTLKQPIAAYVDRMLASNNVADSHVPHSSYINISSDTVTWKQ